MHRDINALRRELRHVRLRHRYERWYALMIQNRSRRDHAKYKGFKFLRKGEWKCISIKVFKYTNWRTDRTHTVRIYNKPVSGFMQSIYRGEVNIHRALKQWKPSVMMEATINMLDPNEMPTLMPMYFGNPLLN